MRPFSHVRSGWHDVRVRGVVVAAIAAVALGLSAAGTVYAVRNSRLLHAEIDWTGALWGLWPAAFVVVGAVVAVAQPRILVGWGLLTIGFATEVAGFGGTYAGWASLSGMPLPLSGLATWLGMVAGGVAIAMAPLVVTRLPSGRPDTRIARLTSRVSWFVGAALVTWWAFGNELLSINTMSGDAVTTPDLPNPLALVHPSRSVTSRITASLTLGLLLLFLWSIALVLARRRRASPAERAQLRWLASGLLVLPLGMVGSSLLDLAMPLTPFMADTVFVMFMVGGLGAIPVSIAMSVLKFRLFEIDRLISRTIAFGVVGMVLGGLYALLATAPSLLIRGSGDVPSWLVAASTLLAAALFNPLRRRVQRIADRRFDRPRYDSEKVIERFSAQVREFADLDTIIPGLTGAVQRALQPNGVAVWVRGATS